MTTVTSVWQILPPYVGGKQDPKDYSAGDGLNDTRHIENPTFCRYFKDGEAMSEAEYLARGTQAIRDGVPSHWFVGNDRRLRFGLFENGRIAVADHFGGTVKLSFLDDYTEETHSPCPVGVVQETTAAAFLAYVDGLVKAGWKKLYENNIEDNLFAELQGEAGLLECSYHPGEHVARLILDTVSCPLADFGYVGGDGKTEVYSFSLLHGRMISGFSCDCGMVYLIKLADNAIWMIDGGELEQCTQTSMDALWQMMHDITGTKPGETIRLNWYCTHAHDDHADIFSHLLRIHHDEIDLQRVMFNYPCTDYVFIAPQLYTMITRVRRYYPNVLYRKLHAGDVFTLGRSVFHVFQTHEQGLGIAEGGYFRGMNDCSTILKMSFDGVSFLWLGDLDNEAEDILVRHFSHASLGADGVQGAHHLFNFLNHVYDVIAPTWCIVPQNEACRTNNNAKKYGQIAKVVAEDHILFDDMGSFGWREEDGKLVNFYHAKPVGTLYDGTEL